ncbi:MAG: YgiT-type zinc finger protein [Deltaproteobacteria bacterium]|nr:YgiT-type zinc finger protein [Deltaproteobacteria bacterium]
MFKKPIKLTQCPMCGSSEIREIVEDRVYEKLGKKVVVPDVPREKCFSCGEQFFDQDSFEVIESFFGKNKKKVATG